MEISYSIEVMFRRIDSSVLFTKDAILYNRTGSVKGIRQSLRKVSSREIDGMSLTIYKKAPFNILCEYT